MKQFFKCPETSAADVLQKIFWVPCKLVREAGDAYRIVLEPGYFRSKAEEAVDAAWERSR